MNIASYTTFGADLAEGGLIFALQHAASLGFTAVEPLGINGDLPFAESPATVRKLLQEYNLSVSCYSVCADFTKYDLPIVEEQLLRQADFAAAIGSPFLHHTIIPELSRSAYDFDYEYAFPLVLPSISRIVRHCNRLGLTALYEPQGMFFNGAEGLQRLLRVLKEQGLSVGICGDSGNSLFVNEDPVNVFREFAGDILHIHAKNYRISPVCDPNLMCLSRDNGDWLCHADLDDAFASVDLPACFACLHGYRGDISVEAHTDDGTLKRYIAYLKSLAEKHF